MVLSVNEGTEQEITSFDSVGRIINVIKAYLKNIGGGTDKNLDCQKAL